MNNNDNPTILIYGATGWIGRSTLAFLLNKFKKINLILISTSKRTLYYKSNTLQTISSNSINSISRLEIDYYFNFAFLTQDKIKVLGAKKYIDLTNQIIENEKYLAKTNSISKAVLVSSGAVHWLNTDKENLYTLQKLKQENIFQENFSKIDYFIPRVFSLIASQYDFNKNYAFTSFLEMAQKNSSIKIDSNIKVVRSFVLLNNLLEFLFNTPNEQLVFDAVSEDLDIFSLAKIIGSIYDVEVQVSENYATSLEVNKYVSIENYFKKISKEKISDSNIKKIVDETNKNKILIK